MHLFVKLLVIQDIFYLPEGRSYFENIDIRRFGWGGGFLNIRIVLIIPKRWLRIKQIISHFNYCLNKPHQRQTAVKRNVVELSC